MNQNQKMALILTGTFTLGVAFGTAIKSENDRIINLNDEQIIEEVTEGYNSRDIEVKIVNTVTGEQELFFFYKGRELFTNYDYSKVSRVEETMALYECISLSDLKSFYTKEELKVLLLKSREEFHGGIDRKNIFDEVNNGENEKTYDIKDLYFILKSDKDGNKEIYLAKCVRHKFFSTFHELFTEEAFPIRDADFYNEDNEKGRFSVIEFISPSELRETYTESELKCLLLYVREILKNDEKIYGSNKLQLTK